MWRWLVVLASLFWSMPVSSASLRIPAADVQVYAVSAQESDFPATYALDGNTATMWHTPWRTQPVTHPHTLDLALRDVYRLDTLVYTPRQDGMPHGTITMYSLYTSLDAQTWTLVATGELAPDASVKTLAFPARPGRFLRLIAQAKSGALPYTSIAELALFGTPGAAPCP